MLHEKIIQCRRKCGLSQEALGEAVGVSRQAVSKWETGDAIPEVTKLVALADVFGVSVDYLVRDGEYPGEIGKTAAAPSSTQAAPSITVKISADGTTAAQSPVNGELTAEKAADTATDEKKNDTSDESANKTAGCPTGKTVREPADAAAKFAPSAENPARESISAKTQHPAFGYEKRSSSSFEDKLSEFFRNYGWLGGIVLIALGAYRAVTAIIGLGMALSAASNFSFSGVFGFAASGFFTLLWNIVIAAALITIGILIIKKFRPKKKRKKNG